MSQSAGHTTISSGQIQFSDPSLPWNPNNFPNLPSTSLALTAEGTIANRNFSTLTFTNSITYDAYEDPSIRPFFQKSMQVSATGRVSYDDPRVSVVSTTIQSLNAPINSFTATQCGGPGIQSPDSLTNAVAKIDGWIANALLYQPPPVQFVDSEINAFYAGIRWHNFKSYRIFDKAIPYVSGIVIILGDPASSDYITLELTNPLWFPDRTYTDGLYSDFTPIVRFRIFSKFFLDAADEIYTKAALQANCIRVIDESGTYTLPSVGKVVAIQHSMNGESYTTFNIYLPNVPIGTYIPVRVAYINNSSCDVNIAENNIYIDISGNPGPVSSIIQTNSSPQFVELEVVKPIYSDTSALVSTPFFSSYQVQYTVDQYRAAHTGNLGIPYGISNPFAFPSYLSSYSNSTFSKSIIYTSTTQTIEFNGLETAPIVPGLQWSTSIYAINSAHHIGPEIAGPSMAFSAYPDIVSPSISDVQISSISPFAADASTSSIHGLTYNGDGWNISTPITHNVLFISTTQEYEFTLTRKIQFNDVSYPGARSNVTLTSQIGTFTNSYVSTDLVMSTIVGTNDFPLNTLLSATAIGRKISGTISDSYQSFDAPFKKFYYDLDVRGSALIGSISTATRNLYVSLQNPFITSFNGPIYAQLLSTPLYEYKTERASDISTISVSYKNSCSPLVQICGIYTPTIGSEFVFDIVGRNFIQFLAGSNIAYGRLVNDECPLGPTSNYISSVRILNGTTPVTTLPFPQNTNLTISSCKVAITSNYYQDPADPRMITIGAAVTPANPTGLRSTFMHDLSPNLFIDTVSASRFMNFNNSNGIYGLRVLSMLPIQSLPYTMTNIFDGVDSNGLADVGLNVSVSSFYVVGCANALTVNTPSVSFNNGINLCTSFNDPYSRELLFTNGHFMHPAGLNFGTFQGSFLGEPFAFYPNFIGNLYSDENYGYRYAQFFYNLGTFETPTSAQYIRIQINTPSAISTISASRTYNYAFPDAPVSASMIPFTKVRIHLKIIGAYNNYAYTPIETAWINCLKEYDCFSYDDTLFDIGGCVDASIGSNAIHECVTTNNVTYTVQIGRREYTMLNAIVRIGIAHDGSAEDLPPEEDYCPITFDSVQISYSDK